MEKFKKDENVWIKDNSNSPTMVVTRIFKITNVIQFVHCNWLVGNQKHKGTFNAKSLTHKNPFDTIIGSIQTN